MSGSYLVEVAGEAAVLQTEVTKRVRGRPARVDRDRIVAVARKYDPSTLTMQAVAAEMGVDRKTLHYWVDNRASLLRMVAADAFREAVEAGAFVAQRDWREALRSFARITRDAIVTAGAWATYVAFETDEDLAAVRPAESAVVALVEAGLPEMDAGDIVRLVAGIAFTSGRNPGPRDAPGGIPQSSNVDQPAEGQYALLRRLLGRPGGMRTIDEQFEFDVQLVILGVERLIDAGAELATVRPS